MTIAIDFSGILSQGRKAKQEDEAEGPNPTFKKKAKEVKPENVPTFSIARTVASANEFLLALKQAGKRMGACGVMKVVPQEVRGDEAKAIEAFTGVYSRGIAHGLQIDFARMEARRIVATGVKTPVKEYCRCSLPTGGNAGGMPDPTERERMALKGQERAAVQALCEGVKGAEVQLKTIRNLIDNLSY